MNAVKFGEQRVWGRNYQTGRTELGQTNNNTVSSIEVYTRTHSTRGYVVAWTWVCVS